MEIFPYNWHTYEENGSLGIRVFGLNNENESVFALITGFTPYVYVELPDNVSWSQSRIQAVSRKLDEICGERDKAVTKAFKKKKKLYYAKKDINEKTGEYIDKTYPFLQCFFGCTTSLKSFVFKAKKPFYVSDIGVIRVKVHESDANPVLQFMCMKNIKPATWFKFKGKKIVSEDDKLSLCDHEYEVKYQSCEPVVKDTVAAPLIMGFDIEVNSTNPNIAPQSSVSGDKVFQISCVFLRNGESEDKYERYILTLCKNKEKRMQLIPEKVGDGIKTLHYENEGDLLIGFTDLVCEKNPQILCGFNIFSFDLPYMYERSKHTATISNFDQISFIKGEHCKEKEIKWSSSAFKNQQFKYLDAHGRLWIDLLPIIKRKYKLENYKLKTVSDFFLGQSKDPLTVKGIFKCYRMFTPESMSIVAKYCVKDSELVVRLFEKLQIWIDMTEMANTCNTPVFDLIVRGEQLKIFSQVYKKCMADEIVIDKDSFIVNDNDHFTGAYVFTPEPGLYDMVVSFDFSSLYPSTIIAYNIDYSTLVMDDKIPDEKCNIFEWEDHQNCSCPNTKVVKGKNGKVVMCGKNRFRFLKEPAGILPTLLKNLLDARKRTNNEKKVLEKRLKEDKEMTPEERASVDRLVTVLDKRQLSYKVSANSMYGGMGVKKGYLPFLPGAMCTTARGRESIEKASKFLVSNYGAKLIYGDTDSCYISFPAFQTNEQAKDLHAFCQRVEDEISSMFPKPMKFAYEEAIYWRYLILTKKRYMALKCDNKTGDIYPKIEKRGVLLSRRDNSAYSREFYSKLIMKAFYKESLSDVLSLFREELNKLYCNSILAKDLTITKSIGEVKDYKIRDFSDDDKKMTERLKKLELNDLSANLEVIRKIFKCYVDLSKPDSDVDMDTYKHYKYTSPLEFEIVEQYIDKSLPSQVQLAEKMRRRGTRVDAGERLGYVVIETDDTKDALFKKIEDVDYFKENMQYLKIDSLYYTKLLINPFDEVLSAVYKKDKIFDQYYKSRVNYFKVLNELKSLFSPKIRLIDNDNKEINEDKKKPVKKMKSLK